MLASNPEVDPSDVSVHPTRHVVEGVVFEPGLPAWTLLDPTVKKDFDVFPHLARGFPEVVSRDRADRTWIVAFRDAQGPTRFFSLRSDLAAGEVPLRRPTEARVGGARGDEAGPTSRRATGSPSTGT